MLDRDVAEPRIEQMRIAAVIDVGAQRRDRQPTLQGGQPDLLQEQFGDSLPTLVTPYADVVGMRAALVGACRSRGIGGADDVSDDLSAVGDRGQAEVRV